MVIPKVVDHWPQLISGLESLVKYTPNFLLEQMLSLSLNQVLSAELKHNQFAFLAKNWVRIEVADLALAFAVTFHGNRLRVSLQAQPVAVTMRGNSASLVLLMSGQIDPDTLFFRRKLLIKGDTELGLAIKNLLDTIELKERLPAPLFRATEAMAAALVARPDLR